MHALSTAVPAFAAIAAVGVLLAPSVAAQTPTTTTVAISAGGSAGTYGTTCPITLTATTTAAGSTPNLGQVALLDGGLVVAGPVALSNNGTAALTWTPSTTGTHTISAWYSGWQATWDSSTSAPVPIAVGTGINLGLACIALP